MFIQKFQYTLIFIGSLLLTACATTPTTEVKTYDPTFSKTAVAASLGIINSDIHQLQPAGTGQAVAGQFGLIGALVWVSAKDAENEADFTVNQRDIQFYRQAFNLLEDRLRESPLLQYTAVVSDLIDDDIALSRHIRNIRLHGSDVPKPQEITTFCNRHHLDLALYGNHYGGVSGTDNRLFMSSNWFIYDSDGKLVVSVFTRSINNQTPPPSMSAATLTAALAKLFSDNMDKFFTVLSQGKA